MPSEIRLDHTKYSFRVEGPSESVLGLACDQFNDNDDFKLPRSMNKQICFSFYRGEPPIPVTVFKEMEWSFDQNLELNVSIIGKSHRIVSRIGGKSFTEFIACTENEASFKPVDHFQVNLGETHQKSYRDGDFFYQVRIEVVPRLFRDMDEFIRSLEKHDWRTLNHGFDSIRKEPGPFTGVAVAAQGNVFHTVHTYPESSHSILSRSEIQYRL